MMSVANMFYEKLERDFVSWAQTVEDIRAAFIVGSRARYDHPADEWSDMDIILFTSKQNYYLSDNEWFNNLGNVWTSLVSQTAGGDPERLILFEGGRQVDFVIHSIEHLKHNVEYKIIPNNFYRGVKVIIDKEDIARNIMPKCFRAPQGTALSEDVFIQSVNVFWFLALNLAKQILRNDLWIAKVRDSNMKELLLQMIEWHEKTVYGIEYDTWHAGRFLCEWASEETRLELRNVFGHFDRDDSWRALIGTITLFKRLSHDISQRLKFSYPYDLENNVSDWIIQNTNLVT